jgi:hypothetical protein
LLEAGQEDPMFRTNMLAALTSAAASVASLTAPVLAAATLVALAATPARAGEVREVTLPAGTVLSLRLDTTVASNSSHVEDGVQAHLRRAVVSRGVTVLPANAPISGIVTHAQQSGRVKGRALVAFRFNSLRAHGEHYRVATSSVVRQAQGTKRRDATEIALPAAGGAIIGALAGGGRGAAIGAAAGGGAGTGVVLATRGKEVRLGRGALVSVRLTQPLTVHVPINGN